MSDTTTTDAAARRSRLIGVKLRALVGDHLGEPIAEAQGFAPGAALVHAGTAWVYLDDRPANRLGAALAWTMRHGCDSLAVVAEAGTGTLARRAAAFEMPIQVWEARGRALVAVEPARLPRSEHPPARHETFRDLIVEGGAVPVVEHGVLTGEVAGLEVCRVVDDDAAGTTRLEVGVGAHDREAFQMLHGDIPPVESLARVVAAVAQHRKLGASQHPLNTLGAERLIRWRVEQEPELVGATVVTPVPPPLPRENLKDPVPCVATGLAEDGSTIVIVCSSGVDLDLIPYATDARLAVSGEPGIGRLVVAMPSRDRIPLVGEIADRLRHPPEFVSVD